MRRFLPQTAIVIFIMTISAFPQESQSLGDIARALRVERNHNTLQTGSSSGQWTDNASFDGQGTSQNEVTEYKVQISSLLEQGRFDELDAMANSARQAKELFPGGMWKLYIFYRTLSGFPPQATDESFINRIKLLEEWKSLRPNSITPQITLAETYVSYAWFARGHKYTAETSDSAFDLFNSRLQSAKAVLDQASGLTEKCPHWYFVMQDVALGQEWSPAKNQELFEQAAAFEPDYQYYYRAYAHYLLPQWYGSEGDFAKFAEVIATKLGGQQGDIIYFEIATSLTCDCDKNILQQMSWDRIKRGYADLIEMYGASAYRTNQLCGIAVAIPDAVTADQMFQQLGMNWEKEVWRTRQEFDHAKIWAKDAAADALQMQQITSEIEANVRTPEGSNYDTQIGKEFGKGFVNAVSQCVKDAGSDLRGFDLLLQLNPNGSVRRLIATPPTAVTACLGPQLEQHTFSAPPAPAYWVKISMQMKP